MADRAHVQNGKLVRLFTGEKGRVVLANGDTVSPVIIGFESGDDKVVPVIADIVDTSTAAHTVTARETLVGTDQVTIRKTVSNIDIKDWRASASMPRKQWALISAENGWITEAEALAWVGGSAIPAWVDRVIDAHIPAEQRLKTKLAVLDSQVIYRIGGLMPFLQAEQGVTDEELDAYFGWTG